MKRIYKYELAFTDLQHVAMVKGAEILSVAIQNNELQLWAMVDTSQRIKNH